MANKTAEENDIEALRKAKDNAYWERDQLVAALSKVFPSHLAKHPEDDKEWEDDWRNIVVIYVPSPYPFTQPPKGDKRVVLHKLNGYLKDIGWYQLTWHIHDTELPNFDHLTYENPKATEWMTEYQWDGHTTEEKYRRLRTAALRAFYGITETDEEGTR